jgi:hypothetical protein
MFALEKSFLDGLDLQDILITSLQLRVEWPITVISTVSHMNQITLTKLIDGLIRMSMRDNQQVMVHIL